MFKKSRIVFLQKCNTLSKYERTPLAILQWIVWEENKNYYYDCTDGRNNQDIILIYLHVSVNFNAILREFLENLIYTSRKCIEICRQFITTSYRDIIASNDKNAIKYNKNINIFST